MVWLVALFTATTFPSVADSRRLDLPPRGPDAENATPLASRLATLSLVDRETALVRQILSGNVPDSTRTLSTVLVRSVSTGITNELQFDVASDYLSVGSTKDPLLIPLSPQSAQQVADALRCVLPTRRMVDLIHAAASLKLAPMPIPPSPQMTTLAAFTNHNGLVRQQVANATGSSAPDPKLVAGHKKDVVITPRLQLSPGKVAIYGWHQTNGVAIQPLYLGHTDRWVDYSQCIRLVSRTVRLNGHDRDIAEVLTNSTLCGMLSDEGPFIEIRYPTNVPAQPSQMGQDGGKKQVVTTTSLPGGLVWKADAQWKEQVADIELPDGVNVHLSIPLTPGNTPGQPLELIVFSLPNGNTIEQTLGRKRPVSPPAQTNAPGGQDPYDWHYDIQHIAAQTRFLRANLPGRTIALACVGNSLHSWPAWRKKYGDARTLSVLEQVKGMFTHRPLQLTLSSHSGGGSFIFGCINALTEIPADWVRFVFLDSNYGYDPALGHTDKLRHWLEGGSGRFLCVIAYNDAVALLNGKSFVSASGGTWGRSLAMRSDLGKSWEFKTTTDPDFQRSSALNNRVEFILKENPGREIFHTVQVEKNGFIHGFLSGTTNGNRGYVYFGPRAYSSFIGD